MNTRRFERCPRCHQPAYVRDDGSFGRHWDSGSRARNRCPEGERVLPPAQPRRRVKVTIDVLVPTGEHVTAYRTQAARVLREHALGLDVHVIDVTADDTTTEHPEEP